MPMAKGAPPMILTIILVHSISYIRPVTPERKKQVRTKSVILLPELRKILSSVISCPYCFERGKAYNDQIPTTTFLLSNISIPSATV